MIVRKQRDAPATFDSQQRRELKQLGVVPEQVEELERQLNYCRAMLRPAPRMADVREELRSLAGTMRTASAALVRFDSAGKDNKALSEAQQRFFIESFAHDNEGVALFQAISALEQIADWTDSALSNLSPEMRRSQSPWEPIARIHSALVTGWGRAYCTVADTSDEEAPTAPASKGVAPYFPHVPSTGITSPFRKIVGVCYAAIGAEFTDPERPIKAFVRQYRSKRHAQDSRGN